MILDENHNKKNHEYSNMIKVFVELALTYYIMPKIFQLLGCEVFQMGKFFSKNMMRNCFPLGHNHTWFFFVVQKPKQNYANEFWIS